MRYAGILAGRQTLKQPRMAIVEDGDIYVSVYGENLVYKQRACDNAIVWQMHVPTPRGLTFDETHGYVACFGDPNGTIVQFTKASGLVTWTAPCPRPRGIVYHNRLLYCTEVKTGKVAVLHASNGTRETTVGRLSEPRGIAIHRRTGAIYVAESNANRVIKMSSRGKVIAHHAANRPNDVACAQERVFVSEWYTCRILSFDLHLKKAGCVDLYHLAGHLSMLTVTPDDMHVLVGDDSKQCVHIIKLSDALSNRISSGACAEAEKDHADILLPAS